MSERCVALKQQDWSGDRWVRCTLRAGHGADHQMPINARATRPFNRPTAFLTALDVAPFEMTRA